MKKQEINDVRLAEESLLLAIERTFSAWLRTAIGAMAVGLAILRLVVFKSELHRSISHIVGYVLLFWGIMLIILASIDYKKSMQMLTIASNSKSSYVGFIIIVIPVLIICMLMLLFIALSF